MYFLLTIQAFAQVPANVLNALLANTTALSAVLLYHVVGGKVLSSQLTNDALVPTLNGASVRTNIYNVAGNTVVTINGAQVTTANVQTSNGVVHVINKVMKHL